MATVAKAFEDHAKTIVDCFNLSFLFEPLALVGFLSVLFRKPRVKRAKMKEDPPAATTHSMISDCIVSARLSKLSMLPSDVVSGLANESSSNRVVMFLMLPLVVGTQLKTFPDPT